MDCKTARLLLDFARPGELAPGDAAALEGHLAGCSDCDALARAERRLDEHIGRAVRAVAVPEGLRSRLLSRLEAGRERRRRLPAWAAAAAACLVAAAGLAYFYWPVSKPPELIVDNLRYDSFLRIPPNRERVEEYFSERLKRSIPTPPLFNYALLAPNYDLAQVQGKLVPLLVFTQGEHRALVYIIDGKQFDIEALLRDGPSNSGGLTVEVWQDPENPQFAYLIIFTGDSLQPFLVRPQATTVSG